MGTKCGNQVRWIVQLYCWPSPQTPAAARRRSRVPAPRRPPGVRRHGLGFMVATQVRSSRTGPPGRDAGDCRRGVGRRWRRHGRVGRCRRRRGRRPLELLHQTRHAPAVAERGRWLRLRVAVVGVRTHTDQTGELILPWPAPAARRVRPLPAACPAVRRRSRRLPPAAVPTRRGATLGGDRPRPARPAACARSAPTSWVRR